MATRSGPSPRSIGCRRAWRALAGVLVVLAGAFCAGTAAADGSPVAESAVKLAITYNVSKFVEWPPSAWANASKPAVLCTLGPADSLQAGLAAIESKPLQGHKLEVRKLGRGGDFAGCNILYFIEPDTRHLATTLAQAHALNILTVSDVDEFVEAGGIIGLLTQNNKVQFAVNLQSARAAGLRMSSELLRLARSVIGTEQK